MEREQQATNITGNAATTNLRSDVTEIVEMVRGKLDETRQQYEARIAELEAQLKQERERNAKLASLVSADADTNALQALQERMAAMELKQSEMTKAFNTMAETVNELNGESEEAEKTLDNHAECIRTLVMASRMLAGTRTERYIACRARYCPW